MASKKSKAKKAAMKAAAAAAQAAAAEAKASQSPSECFWKDGDVQQVGSQKAGMKTFFKPFFGQTIAVTGIITKAKKSTKAGVKLLHIAAIEGKFGMPAGAHSIIAMETVEDKAAFDAIEFGDKVVLSGKVTKHPHKKFGKDFGLEDVKVVKVVSWKA